MTRLQKEISLIIPVFNEDSHIIDSLKKIEDEVKKVTLDYEMIIVEDGSTDGTWKKLSENIKSFTNMFVIRLSRNFGKESALVAGLEYAKGEAIIILDADLQHPPSLISKMVKIWREGGFGIVECVKKRRQKENIRYRIGTKLFYWLLKRFTGYNFDGASDYKLIDKRVLQAWMQMPERNTFFRGMTLWLGYKRAKIEFDVEPRIDGEGKWSFIKLIKLALNAIVSFTSMPLRFVSIAGIIFFMAAFFLGIQTIYQKLIGSAFTGFTTVILLQLVIGSVCMISIGILGEYISAIYKEVKRRPRYLIEDTISSQDTNSKIESKV